MARSSSGRSVARAAATGGGATYRGQMPVNWYAALLVIVLVGLGSIAFAKYNYNQNPPVVEPTVGTTWHAGLAVDICGETEPVLPASPSSAKTGLTSAGSGVLKIAPTSSSEAGNNATLGKFASGYTGFTLTNTSVKYPSSSSPEYKNGQKCAAGTPDAGQVGEVQARWWILSTKTGKNGEVEETGGVTTVHPADLKFVDRQLITVGFVPDNASLPKPPTSTITVPPHGPGRRGPARNRHLDHRTGCDDIGACSLDVERAGVHDEHDGPVFDHHDRTGLDDDVVGQTSDDHDHQVMQAVVLVGGEGTRLRPLTLSSPKQMLPIVGVPMLERVLGQLGAHGVDRAVLSLGYLPDAFLGAYPDGRVAGIELTYAVEPEPLDTAGAVRFAASFAGIAETFVVVNGDVLTDLDLTALIAFHRDRGAEGTIALHPVADPSAFGVVPTDDEGRVTAFVEKPPRDEAPTNEINAGTYVLEASVLDRIPEGGRVSIERETFPAMVRDGGLFALSDDGYWLDTGTPSAYLQANFDYLNQKRGPVVAPGLVDRGDGVLVEGESDVEGDVVGPSVVFSGCVVETGARVERSVLGRGCVVAEGAVISDSVLMDGCHVAADAKVGGSIMGPRSIVGQRGDVRAVSVLGADAVVSSGTLVDGERVSG